jgi:hypothetical protein
MSWVSAERSPEVVET